MSAQSQSAGGQFHINTIPEPFYGGKNPVIYEEPHAGVKIKSKPIVEKTGSRFSGWFKKKAPLAAQTSRVVDEMAAPPLPPAPKARAQPSPMKPAVKSEEIKKSAPAPVQPSASPPKEGAKGELQKPKRPHLIHSPWRWVYVAAGVVGLLGIGGIVWYYLRPSALPPEPPPPVIVVPPILPPEPPLAVTTTTPEIVGGARPLRDTPEPVVFPSLLLADSVDLDVDSLTDAEEALLGTDSGVWDSDRDGYYDGQEVFNLYNPLGFAPIKLIDSGLIDEYQNSSWGYRLYYPKGWELAPVDRESRQVLLSAITGDFVEVRVFEKEGGESFVDWFGRVAVGQQYTDLIPIVNRFQESGFKRRDDLIAYFSTDRVVFVLLYHPGISETVSYRHLMQMVTQSFRPAKSIFEVPDQQPIPGVDASSSDTTSSFAEVTSPSSSNAVAPESDGETSPVFQP